MTPEWKFSIVIPVYNRAAQVGTAIRSILAQTYTNFEIVVVDDGSTDDTASAVRAFNDPRIVYVHQENKERGAARNTGVRAATGDYLTFLDSDDEFFPDHLETVRQFITANPNIDVYCTSYQLASSSQPSMVIMPENIPMALADGNFLSCNGVFLPAALAKAFPFVENREMAGLEDWELWLRIAAKKKSMKGNRGCTSRMNHHDERSVLQTTREKIEKRFDRFYECIDANNDLASFYNGKIRRLKASCETYMALHLAMTKKYRGAAVRHLWKGIVFSPSVIFTRRFAAILKHLP